MKKMIIGIIIGVTATIVIEIVAVLLYTKFFMFVPDKGGMENKFKDEQIVAIGYIKEDKESEFIAKNFVSKEVFDSLLELDYRKELSKEQGIGMTFVILPKNSNVEIEIYDCYIDEQGETKIVDKLGETLNEGFVLKLDYMAESSHAEICIKVKAEGVEDIIPLAFSGEDGRLYLAGHEKLLDISVY